MTGYSGTPLAAKLGIKPGATLLALNAPAHYRVLIERVSKLVVRKELRRARDV